MTGRDRSSAAIRAALLAATLSIVAFLWAVNFGFVYDDRWTLTQNPFLDGSLRALLAAMADGTAVAKAIPDATRPAMVVSLWLDRRLFGGAPLGYHLHSLLLYAATAAAAAVAARTLTDDRTASGTAASFFALAPLHAEAVCAVNYREDLLAALGILIPLAWLFRSSTKGDSVAGSLAIAAVFAWGLLGKESAIALGPVVLSVAILSRVDRAWLEARERTLFLLFAVLVLWLNWRLALIATDDGIPRASPAGLWTRVCDTARFELRAVALSFVPLRPSPEYAAEGHASVGWLLGASAVVALIVHWSRQPRARSIAVGLGVALAAPIAASPLLGPLNARADRYLFVSVLGGGIVVGTLVAWSRPRFSGPAWYATCTLFALAAAALCARAAFVWKDERSLWTYAVERSPESPRAWAALSRVERLSGNLDEADRLIDRALTVDPNHVPSRVTRVYNLLARGHVSAARDEITVIERGGGAPPRGLSRARLCTAGTAEQAKRCIAGGT